MLIRILINIFHLELIFFSNKFLCIKTNKLMVMLPASLFLTDKNVCGIFTSQNKKNFFEDLDKSVWLN